MTLDIGESFTKLQNACKEIVSARMNKNMNSPSKLTEFAPLSPEESQPVVASLFSKFFSFTKSKYLARYS